MGGMMQAANQPYTNYQQYKIDEKLMDQQFDQQKDLMDYQMEQMSKMFPFTELISDYSTDLYGENLGAITDYLENPMPPSNLERQLFEFFGGTQPVKGYYRGAVPGAKKGGPGALTNRLLGRHGAGESGPLAGLGPQLLEEASGYLESLRPYGQEWGETGLKTNIKEIQDYAMRMFEREMIPETVERFGSNIQGSGFQGEMGRTMADVASELGAMEVMLNEAAANRRMQGLSGPIQNLFTGPMNLQTAFATAAAQAGRNYVDRVDAARPGARLVGAMPMFANIDANQGFIQQGFPTSGTDYGNVMSGWGQTAGAATGALGNLFNSWLNRDQTNSMGYNPYGTQTGMGWDQPAGSTQVYGTPWVGSGVGAGTDAPATIVDQGDFGNIA